MPSLYTLKLYVNGHISAAIWEPQIAATVKPLLPCILSVCAHISVRERPSTCEKGREEGKQECNCWHCDHNVRNVDDWCGEAEDRRKLEALVRISLHAQKQHRLSHTDPWDENSADFGESSTSLAQGAMWQILNGLEPCPPRTGNDLPGLVRLIIHISHPQEKGVWIVLLLLSSTSATISLSLFFSFYLSPWHL